MTDEPLAADRQDDLTSQCQAFTAHGIFNAQAHTISPQLWATKHRTTLGAVAAGVAAGALATWRHG